MSKVKSDDTKRLVPDTFHWRADILSVLDAVIFFTLNKKWIFKMKKSTLSSSIVT